MVKQQIKNELKSGNPLYPQTGNLTAPKIGSGFYEQFYKPHEQGMQDDYLDIDTYGGSDRSVWHADQMHQICL